MSSNWNNGAVFVLVASNDGIECEVIGVTADAVTNHNTAMTAKLAYDIVVSSIHRPAFDGAVPEIGMKFKRKASNPLRRNLAQSWYSGG